MLCLGIIRTTYTLSLITPITNQTPCVFTGIIVVAEWLWMIVGMAGWSDSSSTSCQIIARVVWSLDVVPILAHAVIILVFIDDYDAQIEQRMDTTLVVVV